VPGLGGDANENYREHLAQFVASEFEVVVASVNYHCIGSRPQTGATYFLNDLDKIILKNKCSKIGIEIPSDISYGELSVLDAYLGNIKSSGGLPSDFKLEISVTLQPTKNEYQNSGVMRAQDVINAALFIKANPPFKPATDIDELPVAPSRQLARSLHKRLSSQICSMARGWSHRQQQLREARLGAHRSRQRGRLSQILRILDRYIF
jgi:carbonic anyhydrase